MRTVKKLLSIEDDRNYEAYLQNSSDKDKIHHRSGKTGNVERCVISMNMY